jgi:hypothetical protein
MLHNIQLQGDLIFWHEVTLWNRYDLKNNDPVLTAQTSPWPLKHDLKNKMFNNLLLFWDRRGRDRR